MTLALLRFLLAIRASEIAAEGRANRVTGQLEPGWCGMRLEVGCIAHAPEVLNLYTVQ